MCHRLETGLSSLARTCSRTLTFLKRLHTWSHLLTPFTSENHDTKNWRWFSLRHSCHLSVLQSVFSAPPGASCTVVLRKIIHKTFCSCNRSRFVHQSNFRRHGMAFAKKNFFPYQRHSHSFLKIFCQEIIFRFGQILGSKVNLCRPSHKNTLQSLQMRARLQDSRTPALTQRHPLQTMTPRGKTSKSPSNDLYLSSRHTC